MSLSREEKLKAELTETNPEFRTLAREHARLEARLAELQSLAFPTDQEQLEETRIKKQKLALKDQMQAILARYGEGRPAEKAMAAGARA